MWDRPAGIKHVRADYLVLHLSLLQTIQNGIAITVHVVYRRARRGVYVHAMVVFRPDTIFRVEEICEDRISLRYRQHDVGTLRIEPGHSLADDDRGAAGWDVGGKMRLGRPPGDDLLYRATFIWPLSDFIWPLSLCHFLSYHVHERRYLRFTAIIINITDLIAFIWPLFIWPLFELYRATLSGHFFQPFSTPLPVHILQYVNGCREG